MSVYRLLLLPPISAGLERPRAASSAPIFPRNNPAPSASEAGISAAAPALVEAPAHLHSAAQG